MTRRARCRHCGLPICELAGGWWSHVDSITKVITAAQVRGTVADHPAEPFDTSITAPPS